MARLAVPRQANLAWASDIHLDHAGPVRADAFIASLAEAEPDGVLLGGDISVGSDVVQDVLRIAAAVRRPVHFVMGNHDYWGWSVSGARSVLSRLTGPHLGWLPAVGCVEVAEGVGLVGHGGWGDARHGDLLNSDVVLNDYVHIKELDEVFVHGPDSWDLSGQQALVDRLQQLGADAADTLEPALHTAASLYTQVIVLTHVPPFPAGAFRDGRPMAEAWLHGYTCGAMGEMLERMARSRRGTTFTVLCGHTHGEGRVEIRPNLVVHNGEARYGHPRFRMLQVSRDGIEVASTAGAPALAGDEA